MSQASESIENIPGELSFVESEQHLEVKHFVMSQPTMDSDNYRISPQSDHFGP